MKYSKGSDFTTVCLQRIITGDTRHSRALAVPRENNEHGCVYLRCRAVCKLPGCAEGHPWSWQLVDVEVNMRLNTILSSWIFSAFFYIWEQTTWYTISRFTYQTCRRWTDWPPPSSNHITLIRSCCTNQVNQAATYYTQINPYTKALYQSELFLDILPYCI